MDVNDAELLDRFVLNKVQIVLPVLSDADLSIINTDNIEEAHKQLKNDFDKLQDKYDDLYERYNKLLLDNEKLHNINNDYKESLQNIHVLVRSNRKLKKKLKSLNYINKRLRKRT